MIDLLIERGASAMKIALPVDAPEKFRQFHEMLAEANRRMNLTRVPDDPQEAVDRHDLDSLSPLCLSSVWEQVHSLLDVGAGAGFPGIPLAIARPDIKVTLMDSQRKRVDFLNEVIQALNLNALAVHARAEDAAKMPAYRDAFDLVTARAVATLNVLAELSLPFVKTGGYLIAYKGPSLPEELSAANTALAQLKGSIVGVHPSHIPGRDWDHRLLVVQKTAATPRRFPRKAGEAGRNPITDGQE